MATNAASQPTFLTRVSSEGPRFIDVTGIPTYDAPNATMTVLYTQNVLDAGMSGVQSIEVNNSQNNFDAYVTVVDSGQVFRIPAGCRGTRNVVSSTVNFALSILYDSSGYIYNQSPAWSVIPVRLFNFPQERSFDFMGGRDSRSYSYSVNPGGPVGTSQAYAASTMTPIAQSYYNMARTRLCVITDGGNAAGSVTQVWENIILGTGSAIGENMALVAVLTGPNASYYEIQMSPEQPICKGPLAVYSTTAGTVWFSQWTTGGGPP
jgi:hypothetical protein